MRARARRTGERIYRGGREGMRYAEIRWTGKTVAAPPCAQAREYLNLCAISASDNGE
jgi:hypothetical protein